MSEDKKTATFKTKFDYALNLVGLMVGFSNVWRFPYVCYKNGGGAFILAYVILVILLIFPLAAIEGALGQYSGKSVVKVWGIVPLFKGLGYTAPFMMVYWLTVLAVLMSWAVRWLWASFSSDPVWLSCNNTWNTAGCVPVVRNLDVNSSVLSFVNSTTVYRSSVEEFFKNNILAKSDSLEDYGTIKPDLLLCLVIVWVAAYFSVWKGIGWTSKVVYFTATAPIIMLVVLVIRGATLEGASNGIKEYLKPDIVKLSKLQVWAEAAAQVLFSFGVCTGGLPTISKFNSYHHNYLRDVVILLVSNAVASFLAGFACFTILGHLALEKNVTIEDIAEKGPALVFVVYPAAMSLLPGHQIWCPLFFIMMLLLGFDSLFVYHETFVCCLKDLFPQWFRFKYANETWIAVTGLMMLLFGMTMITSGGIYVLEIFNSFGVTGWCLFIFALAEFVVIGWAYGSDKMCDLIEDMVEYKLGLFRKLFNIIWRYVGPVIAAIFVFYSLSLSDVLKYDSYVYPTWANVLGWTIAFTSSLVFPATAIWILCRTKATCWRERLGIVLRRRNLKRSLQNDDEKEDQKQMLSSSL